MKLKKKTTCERLERGICHPIMKAESVEVYLLKFNQTAICYS